MISRLRPYLKYVKEVRGAVIAAIIFGILYGAFSGMGLPLVTQFIIPKIFSHQLPRTEILLWISVIPVVFFMRAFSSYGNSYFTQLAGVRMLENIRLDYFKKLQVLPLSFIQRNSTGDLISRGLADTAQLQNTLSILSNDGVKQPFTLIGALAALVIAALMASGVKVMLLALTIVPLTVLPVRYVGRMVIKRAQKMQSHLGDTTGYFSENLSAAREVRAFCLEDHSARRFKKNTSLLIEAQMKIAKYTLALTPSIELISACAISGALLLGYDSGINMETFIAMITAIYFCYEPIKKLGGINSEIKRALASLDRLEMVLHEPVSITDPETPVKVQRLSGSIAFQDLTFSYKDDERVLENLSITIPAGTVCALVGPSGSGKTTFANLVPRLYDATGGAVTIDGIDVRAMRLADLRRNIALVSQEPVLFNDTIYNNLLLGRPDATRAEVEQAAKDAFAHDFIEGLEGGQGYETNVGERGSRLSGGQKQRIALARAFLRNAPILILDEATSALDTASEAYIQQALKKLMVGRTVLIIAHRFSTIRDASTILVFDKDRKGILASGTHTDLYATCALYKELCDKQSGAGDQLA